MGNIFSKIPPEDLAKLKDASPEEKAEIFKKAGITEEQIEQMRNMMKQGGPGGFGGGPPGGGNRGPGGGGGGFRGPGGGGN